jgi:hypothetical protein
VFFDILAASPINAGELKKMTWEELQAVKNHQDCHFDYET